MSHHIFLSYSTKDKAAAEAICEALEREDIRVWMAPRNIPPGAPWPEAIVKAIRSSQALMLLLSDNANASKDIFQEVYCAANNNVKVLTIRIADTKPSDRLDYYVGASQWLDAFPPKPGPHLRNLARTTRGLLQPPSPPFKSIQSEQLVAAPGQGNLGSSVTDRQNAIAASRSKRFLWAPLVLGLSAAAAIFLVAAKGGRTVDDKSFPPISRDEGVSTGDSIKANSVGTSVSCGPNALWKLVQATGVGDIPGAAQITPDGIFRVSGQPVDLADVGGIRRDAIGKAQEWFSREGPNVSCREIGSSRKYCCDLGSTHRSDVSSRLLSEGWATPATGLVRN